MLPEDTDLLRQIIVEMGTQLEMHERRYLRVQTILEQLLRWRFGRKSERTDERQLYLFAMQWEAEGHTAQQLADELGLDPNDPMAPDKEEDDKPKRRGHGRNPLPPALKRERIEYELSEAERKCPRCAETMPKIGEDVSERLEFIPAQLKVIEEARAKYACRCGDTLKTAPKPAQPIEKGLAGASLLAQIAVAKFADHAPLNRQERIFRRHGAELSRKTMCGWLRQTADLLTPLYERLKAQALASKVVQTDDTPVAVLDRSLPKTRTGRIWTYVGKQATVYDYTPTRKRDGPERFLKDYRGYLQADAYAGYDKLYDDPERGLIEVACMAHARRKVWEARSSNLLPMSTVLGFIALLYRIERRVRNASSAERQAFRQRYALPVLEELHALLERIQDRVLPKSPEGMAVSYALSNWRALCRYVEDGDLSIDNSGAERSLRGTAIGRKNWCFFGSDNGGRTAAILKSFIASCQQSKVEPWSYLCDVLTRIAAHPVNALDQLLPAHWKPASA